MEGRSWIVDDGGSSPQTNHNNNNQNTYTQARTTAYVRVGCVVVFDRTGTSIVGGLFGSFEILDRLDGVIFLHLIDYRGARSSVRKVVAY